MRGSIGTCRFSWARMGIRHTEGLERLKLKRRENVRQGIDGECLGNDTTRSYKGGGQKSCMPSF